MGNITVRLWVCERPETGETFLFPTEQDINEAKSLELAEVETRLQAELGSGTATTTVGVMRKRLIADIDARYERAIADRKAALPAAKELSFELRRPTFGEKTDCYAAAQRIDFDNAQGVVNSVEYANRLLSVAIGEQAMRDLDPVVGEELRNRVFRMVHPDPKRLPFTAGPLSRS